MKLRVLAIAALLVISEAGAIECGPIVRNAAIRQLLSSLDDIRGSLLRHFDALQSEVKVLLSTASPQNENLTKIEKIQLEIQLIDLVQQVGDGTREYLNISQTLVLVRDKMVDERDRRTVGKFLSLSLSSTRRTAEKGTETVGSYLTAC